MNITLDKSSSTSLYHQIYDAIRKRILSGELAYGSRLPAERKLCQSLGVNRHTVITAYELLKSEGFLDSFSGRGTFVAYRSDAVEEPCRLRTFHDWTGAFENNQKNRHDNVIQLIMDANMRKDSCFFAGGLPSNQTIPNEAFRRLSGQLLKDPSLNVLSQSAVSGVGVLKKEIKYLMTLRDVHSSVKEQLITSGSQQALDLVFKAFIQEGDTVLVEEPTFFGALQLLRHYGANIVTIPMDRRGMQTSILEYMIHRHQPKFIYTVPTYHNPTGITMAPSRRRELIALSNKYNIPIIEDDPYSAIRFEGTPVPTLKSMDVSNQVIYISTFSKTVSLGVRIGWIIADEEVIRHLVKIKQISDLHVNSLQQYTMAAFIASTEYKAHVRKVTEIYKNKRDLMIQALQEHFTDISFDCPEGGFYLWITFHENIPMRALFEEGLRQKVVITPGYHFMPDGKDHHARLRLNFTYPSEQEITEGIKTLASCYQRIRDK